MYWFGIVTLAERLIEDLPYLKAEVIHACRQEMAMTPYDILARRTSITLEDRDRGLGVVKDVAAMMAQELHWTPERTQAMINAYRAPIQHQIDAEVGV